MWFERGARGEGMGFIDPAPPARERFNGGKREWLKPFLQNDHRPPRAAASARPCMSSKPIANHMENTPTPDLPDNQDQLFANLVESFSSRWPRPSDKPEENPTSALRALWLAAAGHGCSLQKASERTLPHLTGAARKRLDQLIGQRLSGEPLAHIIGWQNFMGLDFKTGPQALIPRKETEILGNAALKRLRRIARKRGRVKVIDLCTGSGNLAIALAASEPACDVFAADLSPEAIGLARENAAIHRLQERVEFRVGDLFAPFARGDFDRAVDMVVCNPPYLSTSKVRLLPPEISEFEPEAAFDAGSFGLAIITRLISETPRYLKPASWLCFEVGLGQGSFFASRLKQVDAYRTLETAMDAAGEARALIAGT
jgi:release factor glutamine methyltransferase